MKFNKYFVIDFDSTFTKVEAFDVLAEIIVKEHPDSEAIKKKIFEITNLGMEGKISFELKAGNLITRCYVSYRCASKSLRKDEFDFSRCKLF